MSISLFDNGLLSDRSSQNNARTGLHHHSHGKLSTDSCSRVSNHFPLSRIQEGYQRAYILTEAKALEMHTSVRALSTPPV